MEQYEISAALEPLLGVLKKFNVPYYICGSLASSIYGIARSTQDVDMVSDLRNISVDLFVKLLCEDYFITADMINEAIKDKSSFNLIHLETMIKIDVFILKDDPYHRISLKRLKEDSIDPDKNLIKVNLSSAEDVILSKLHWYKIGNEISERQWLDILGVIKIQGDKLDKKFLLQWSEYLEVDALLKKAFAECDFKI